MPVGSLSSTRSHPLLDLLLPLSVNLSDRSLAPEQPTDEHRGDNDRARRHCCMEGRFLNVFLDAPQFGRPLFYQPVAQPVV